MYFEQLSLADQSFNHNLGPDLGFGVINGATIKFSDNNIEYFPVEVNSIRTLTSDAVRDLLARPGARRLGIGDQFDYTSDSGKIHRVTVVGYAENDTKIALRMENGLQFMVKAKADKLVRVDTTDRIISIRRPEEEKGTDYKVGEKIVYRKTNGETIEAFLNKGPNVGTFEIKPLEGGRSVFVGIQGLGRVEKSVIEQAKGKVKGFMKGVINVGIAAGVALGSLSMLGKTASANTGDDLYAKPFMNLDGRYGPDGGYVNPLATSNPDQGWKNGGKIEIAQASIPNPSMPNVVKVPKPPKPVKVSPSLDVDQEGKRLYIVQIDEKGQPFVQHKNGGILHIRTSNPDLIVGTNYWASDDQFIPKVVELESENTVVDTLETMFVDTPKKVAGSLWDNTFGRFFEDDKSQNKSEPQAPIVQAKTLEKFELHTIHTESGDVSFSLKTDKELTADIELIEKTAESNEVMILLEDGTVLFEDAKNVKYSGGDSYSIERAMAKDGTLAQAKENIQVSADIKHGYGGLSGGAEIKTHVSVPDMPVEVGGGLKLSFGEGVHEEVVDLAGKLGVSFSAVEEQTIGLAIAVGTNRLKAGATLTQYMEADMLKLYANVEHVEKLLKSEQPALGSISIENVDMATLGAEFQKGVQVFSGKVAHLFSGDAVDKNGNLSTIAQMDSSWYLEGGIKTPLDLNVFDGLLDARVFAAFGKGDGSILGVSGEFIPGEETQGYINNAFGTQDVQYYFGASFAREVTNIIKNGALDTENNINVGVEAGADWSISDKNHLVTSIGGERVGGENAAMLRLKFYQEPKKSLVDRKESLLDQIDREVRHDFDRSMLRLAQADENQKQKILVDVDAAANFFSQKMKAGKLRNNLDRAYQVLITKFYVEGAINTPDFDTAKAVAQYAIKEFGKKVADPAYLNGGLRESMSFQSQQLIKILNSWKRSPMYNAAEVAQLDSYIAFLNKLSGLEKKTNSLQQSRLIQEFERAMLNIDSSDTEMMRSLVNAAIRKANVNLSNIPACVASFNWSVADGDTLTINTGTLPVATHSCGGYSVTYSASGLDGGNIFAARQVLGVNTPDNIDTTATLRDTFGAAISSITRNVTVN